MKAVLYECLFIPWFLNLYSQFVTQFILMAVPPPQKKIFSGSIPTHDTVFYFLFVTAPRDSEQVQLPLRNPIYTTQL